MYCTFIRSPRTFFYVYLEEEKPSLCLVMPAAPCCSAVWMWCLDGRERRRACLLVIACCLPWALQDGLGWWGLLGRRELLKRGQVASATSLASQPSLSQGKWLFAQVWGRKVAAVGLPLWTLKRGLWQEDAWMGSTQASFCRYPAHSICLRRALGSLRVSILLGLWQILH